MSSIANLGSHLEACIPNLWGGVKIVAGSSSWVDQMFSWKREQWRDESLELKRNTVHSFDRHLSSWIFGSKGVWGLGRHEVINFCLFGEHIHPFIDCYLGFRKMSWIYAVIENTKMLQMSFEFHGMTRSWIKWWSVVQNIWLKVDSWFSTLRP